MALVYLGSLRCCKRKSVHYTTSRRQCYAREYSILRGTTRRGTQRDARLAWSFLGRAGPQERYRHDPDGGYLPLYAAIGNIVPRVRGTAVGHCGLSAWTRIERYWQQGDGDRHISAHPGRQQAL